MNIKQAAKILEDKYMTMNGVYGVNIESCKNCDGDFIVIKMNTQNRSLLTSIPSSFQGFRVEKVHQDAPIELQNDVAILPAAPYYYGYPAFGYTTYGGWGRGGWGRGGHGGHRGGGGRRR